MCVSHMVTPIMQGLVSQRCNWNLAVYKAHHPLSFSLSLLSDFYLCDPMISPNEPESDKVLFFNFNQDYSCVSIGTTSGYQMYNCDPFGQCHSQGKHFILLSLGVSLTSLKTGNAGTSIAEMLFSTSLVALVGVGTCPEFNSRDLHIINTKVSIG